jgi:signal transduction histidine kinase
MSDTGSSSASRLLIAGWAASAVVNVVLMYLLPGSETVPFHLVWIGLSITYGFTHWRPLGMSVALGAVAISTGYILVHHARAGQIGWQETTEVPLMTLVFGIMVWHVRRRQQAMADLARLAHNERRRAEVQHLFVRLASHELRTPITVARGYTELVRGASSEVGLREDTAIVLEELDKLAGITQRLVTLMQMDGLLARQPTSVDAELARIVRRWEPTADRKWTVHSDIGDVPINRERFEAALDCLLENAVKFTSAGDRIEVTGTATYDSWTIEVTDSGIGLNPEDAAALSASGAPPRRTTSGTGLGLAIARAVVESWSGRLSLRGELGVGTTVTLRFPRGSAEAAQMAGASQPRVSEPSSALVHVGLDGLPAAT